MSGAVSGWPMGIMHIGMMLDGNSRTLCRGFTRSAIGYMPHQTAPSPMAFAATRRFSVAAEQSWVQNSRPSPSRIRVSSPHTAIASGAESSIRFIPGRESLISSSFSRFVTTTKCHGC